MSRVGIVIPFYKKEEQLAKCKDALKEQTLEHEVLVHDNTHDNVGFTKAVNIGLRRFLNSKDYTVVLNQDCYLDKDALQKMVEFMDKNPRCAIGGIKQISTKDDDMIIHGGCTQAFPNGMHIVGRVSKGECSKSAQMPWVNGACVIVRNSAIPEFGLMDENYFLIGSDSDWCYTARQRGWEVWYIAEASCKHEDTGVSRGKRDRKTTLNMKLDMTYFGDKWIADGCFRELSLEIFN